MTFENDRVETGSEHVRREHYFFLGIALVFAGFITVPVGALLFDSSSVEQMIKILIVSTILIVIGLILLQLSKSSRVGMLSNSIQVQVV
jgi:hypothetical protein